ncbi:hypothetical protein CXF79_06965 [Colwellia sp. Bg11-28]|nr:hypothetical protein CXF79_06965 [Colwellia sp. Bg11-28]
MKRGFFRIIAPALSNRVLPVPSAFSRKLHPCTVLININNVVNKPFKLVLWEHNSKLLTSKNELNIE